MAAVRQYNDSSNTATLSSPNPRLLSKPTVSVSEVPIDGDVEEGEIEESNEGMAFRLEQTKLISSPYTNIENQLDLQTLELHDRLFALALTEMQPTRPDYATAPWTSTFNWPVVFDALRKSCQAAGVQWQCREYYVVIFRSKLQVGANRTRLGLLDQKSHGEACASGGLLKYWFGTTDAERQNVATCIWRNREDAAAGGGGPWHKQARAAAREMYDRITFHTHKLVIEEDVKGWSLEDYVG